MRGLIRRSEPAVIALAVSLTVGGAGVGYAASSLTTGKQIASHTITAKNIKHGSIELADLSRGVQSLVMRGRQPGTSGARGNTGGAGTNGINGAVGSNGSQGAGGANGSNGADGANSAVPVRASGDAGWNLSGTDPATSKGATFGGGALHLHGGFDSSTAQGGIGIAHSYANLPLSTFTALGYVFSINERTNGDAPTIHLGLLKATDSKFPTSGFTNLVYVPAFNGMTGRDATVDAFAPGNKWYSTGLDPAASGGQNNPLSIQEFITRNASATIFQVAVDNGNTSGPGTVPYAAEDFSADNVLVGFGGSFTRYDMGA